MTVNVNDIFKNIFTTSRLVFDQRAGHHRLAKVTQINHHSMEGLGFSTETSFSPSLPPF